jgi:hypothetical protein
MKGKLAQLSLGVVLLAALAIGAAGCGSSGISALTVDGHQVSQNSVDDELKALRDNAQFRALADRQAANNANSPRVSDNPYSVTTGLSSAWVTNLITDELVKLELASQHATVSAADKAAALSQAPQNFGTKAVFDAFPKSFRDAFVARGARVFALARALNADITSQAGVTTVLTALARRAVKAHISVDPRYGTWNLKQLAVDPPLAPGEPRPKTVNPAAGG